MENKNEEEKDVIEEKNDVIKNNYSRTNFVTQIPSGMNQFINSYVDYSQQFSRMLTREIQELRIISKISNMIEELSPIKQIANNLAEAFKPIVTEIVNSLPKMSSYFQELYELLEKARENPDSLANWVEYSRKLSDYMWTIPYDISSDELKILTQTVNSEEEFDKYMLKYFNKEKIEKLFEYILIRLNRKHKTIAKQIKNAYFLKDYALANVALLSIIDELCSQFLMDKGCLKRQDILLPIIETIDNSSEDMFEVIPILVLNNNINVIYENINFNKRIRIKTNKKVRRNPSQHGRAFSNKKIDTIMLLNTIYYLLIVMENYKQYLGKIIYVRNNKEITIADTKHSQDKNRFYIRKKHAKIKK